MSNGTLAPPSLFAERGVDGLMLHDYLTDQGMYYAKTGVDQDGHTTYAGQGAAVACRLQQRRTLVVKEGKTLICMVSSAIVKVDKVVIGSKLVVGGYTFVVTAKEPLRTMDAYKEGESLVLEEIVP